MKRLLALGIAAAFLTLGSMGCGGDNKSQVGQEGTKAPAGGAMPESVRQSLKQMGAPVDGAAASGAPGARPPGAPNFPAGGVPPGRTPGAPGGPP